MAVTPHTYTKLALSMNGIAFTTDTFKVMLLSAYTVGTTQDTAQFISDVLAVGTEAVGTGYTAGGQAIASPTFAESGHVYTWTTATNPSWNAAGGALAAAYAVFYKSTGTNSTSPVLGYWDFGGTQTATNGTFVLTISGSGILTVTGA